MRKNYKDDFDFILHLYSVLADSEGKEVEGSRKELGWRSMTGLPAVHVEQGQRLCRFVYRRGVYKLPQ